MNEDLKDIIDALRKMTLLSDAQKNDIIRLLHSEKKLPDIFFEKLDGLFTAEIKHLQSQNDEERKRMLDQKIEEKEKELFRAREERPKKIQKAYKEFVSACEKEVSHFEEKIKSLQKESDKNIESTLHSSEEAEADAIRNALLTPKKKK